jgi:hypothetical protein
MLVDEMFLDQMPVDQMSVDELAHPHFAAVLKVGSIRRF